MGNYRGDKTRANTHYLVDPKIPWNAAPFISCYQTSHIYGNLENEPAGLKSNRSMKMSTD